MYVKQVGIARDKNKKRQQQCGTKVESENPTQQSKICYKHGRIEATIKQSFKV
jgi:hypothetical protein